MYRSQFKILGMKKITVYENTTLGTSEFFPKQALNHIVSPPPKSKTSEIDESYDLKHGIDSISQAIPIKVRHKFAELMQQFADVFSKEATHYEHPDQRENS